MGVPINGDVFLTLQVYLGGYYTRRLQPVWSTWQVNLQADPGRRLTPDDVKQLKVRNKDGTMVPLGKHRGGAARRRTCDGDSLQRRDCSGNQWCITAGCQFRTDHHVDRQRS